MYSKAIRGQNGLNISVWKLFFPVASILLFLIILFSIKNVPEAEYLSNKIPLSSESNSLDIKNGEIYGLTNKKDSFYFTSSEINYANLISYANNTLVMNNLVGQIEYSKEDILFAKSPKAEYLFQEKKIQSVNNVFYNKDESVFGKSVNLEIDLNMGYVESRGPSLISGHNFFVTAKYLAFVVPSKKQLGDKMILHFRNGVFASFNPKR